MATPIVRLAVIALLFSIAGDTRAAAPAGAQPRLSLRLTVGGVEAPVEVVNDGKRLFVVEQPGRIRQIVNGRVASDAYLDIVKQVTFQGECGFLGVAFHPNFAKNGLFYVDYTAGYGTKLHTVIAEFHADPKADRVDPATQRILLQIAQPFPNHNGGQVKFGPDGMLYIGMGDG